MKSLKVLASVLIVLATFVIACSVLKKENDQEVEIFLTKFQNTLAVSTDEEILKTFQTSQPRETLIQAIRVLQNKASDVVECNASFTLAMITRQKDFIEVNVPVTVRTKNVDNPATEEAYLNLNLTASDDSYVITKFEAEQVYQAYTSVKNASQWAVEQAEELNKRMPIYAKAQALQQSIDTVFWYTTYKENNYYYAAGGRWINYFVNTNEGYDDHDNPKCGLLDEQGAVVLPMEFDLIGTIGFEVPDMVEVKKDGAYGYFDIISRKMVIEPLYEMIIPVQKENVLAIVKQDTTFGWVNNNFEYTPGFPSPEIETWVKTFKYLSKEVVLKDGNQVYCEIPNKEFAGYGIIMPPSYLVKHRLFDEIVSGVNTTKVPMNGWTDYFGIQESDAQSISDKLNAIITVVQERYLGGREEFYGESKVVFMNDHHDLIAITSVSTDQDIEITAIDSTLIQIKAYSTGKWFDAPGEEYDIPEYRYFKMNSDYNLKEVPSNRRYAFTEFIKIDSSYLSGPFKRYTGYDEETETSAYVELDFLSQPTLEDMRNEILASYGFIFPDQTIRERFSTDWYDPRFNNVSEFEEKLTEIDRYNLDFLAKLIALMESQSI
jgi:hypothetical protein